MQGHAGVLAGAVVAQLGRRLSVPQQPLGGLAVEWGWVPQASTSRVSPPARSSACTVRAWRSSPECEAAMMANASTGAGKL
jgi:hypothetical protein